MSEFKIQNKTVYILSPERWGTMRFSKHHYALELAQLGNRVYFIEPLDLSKKGIQITMADENPLLHIVSYKPVYRAKRFLPAFVYRSLVHLQVKLLIDKIGVRPDIVWSFDPFRFLNLQWFGAKVRIFFLADLLPIDDLPGEALTADFCLGLSDSRLAQLRKGHKPALFINHGLSRYYAEKAVERLKDLEHAAAEPRQQITAGYIGNLMMEAPDREVMRKVITANPEVRFIFWGQYEKGGQLVAFEQPDVYAFIEFLKTQPNVDLRGAVHPDQLSREIVVADLFWVCWKIGVSKMWDGSNPHKILEYLSTGKPLVTHYLDAYKNCEWIDMMRNESNSGFPEKFHEVIERVRKGDPVALQKKRINLALENTYRQQIAKIESFVQQYCTTAS